MVKWKILRLYAQLFSDYYNSKQIIQIGPSVSAKVILTKSGPILEHSATLETKNETYVKQKYYTKTFLNAQKNTRLILQCNFNQYWLSIRNLQPMGFLA